MEYHSAMKSHLEKNNLRYFTLSPNAEKHIKALIRHLPQDTPAEDTSNSLEELRFNVINARQMTATRTAPNGQTQVEPFPLFPFTLTRNKISRNIQAE
jgi:hypothetical protein